MYIENLKYNKIWFYTKPYIKAVFKRQDMRKYNISTTRMFDA